MGGNEFAESDVEERAGVSWRTRGSQLRGIAPVYDRLSSLLGIKSSEPRHHHNTLSRRQTGAAISLTRWQSLPSNSVGFHNIK